MYLAKPISYNDIPDGKHRAKVVNMTHELKAEEAIPKHEVRITLMLPDLKDSPYERRVGRTYRETDAQELRHDLYVLGEDIIDELIDDDGMLRPENLHLLKKRECILDALNIHNDRHPKPFVKISNFRKLPEKAALN